MKIWIKSCLRKWDRVEMNWSKDVCSEAEKRGGWRQAGNKSRRAVSMKTAKERTLRRNPNGSRQFASLFSVSKRKTGPLLVTSGSTMQIRLFT